MAVVVVVVANIDNSDNDDDEDDLVGFNQYHGMKSEKERESEKAKPTIFIWMQNLANIVKMWSTIYHHRSSKYEWHDI